jgi:RIO kinase 1
MIIDLPQASDAAHNNRARDLLVRDVTNIRDFLARFAPEIAETAFGEEMWALYERARLTPDAQLTGRWRPPNRRVDTRGVLREIEDAAFEARARRRPGS